MEFIFEFLTRFSQVTLGSSKPKWSWQHLTTRIHWT